VLKIRLVAKIDVKDHQVVKGVRLEGLRVLGSAELFAEKYFLEGIDEIFYHDVIASLLGRNALLELIKNTAKNIFIPITVSGGVRTLKDIYNLLNSGADRVSLNSEVFKNKNIISQAVKEFGSTTIINSMDIGKINNKYFLFTENGKNKQEENLIDWIKKIQDFGVGEFVINAIHKDGTLEGIDHELLNIIEGNVNVPYIFGGGIGKREDLKNISSLKKINGIFLSSILHYNYIDKNYSDNFGNTAFLQSNIFKKKVEKNNIQSIKSFLKKNKIECRV
jgi:imidazoleglycerol phosphate synthase cyclase subunit